MRASVISKTISGILLCVFSAVGQEKSTVRLTQVQATKDMKAFVQLLELSHPDPYINMGGMVEFHRKARDLINGVPAEGLTASELGERLNVFLTSLRDGHTTMYSTAGGKLMEPAIWLLAEIGVASDGLFVFGSDIPQLGGTRGYRLRGANSHRIEEIMAKTCDPRGRIGQRA